MNMRPALGLFALCFFVISSIGTAQTPSSSPHPGRAILTQSCLICHGPELIEGQRLTQAQWERTVEKMRGWGSPLKDSEKEALLIYLTDNYSTDSPPVSKKFHKPLK